MSRPVASSRGAPGAIGPLFRSGIPNRIGFGSVQMKRNSGARR